jgi:uncharacterized small protein (DUF1192 family)
VSENPLNTDEIFQRYSAAETHEEYADVARTWLSSLCDEIDQLRARLERAEAVCEAAECVFKDENHPVDLGPSLRDWRAAKDGK